MEKTQQILIKIVFALATAILLALLCTGIIQTFSHKSLLAKNAQLNSQNQQILQDIEQVEKEIEIRESNEYLDDYLQQEKGYGKPGDIIINPTK
jgi:cell division protein FtsB